MTIKMNKIMKVISSFMVIMLIASTFTMVFADEDKTRVEPGIWKTQAGSNISDSGVKSWIASILNIVAVVGSGIAVIALIILGIKYMMGSVEEKAEYKKTMMPYLIGALMVFGASAIVTFIAGAIK